ncbi:hypothetical protein [Pseudalkalibacillus decolorationis]|uniref:hypothetical protein n=1 Tax=Pseudalkalibacillus decolorationis TaxID=163879 RepID=UPI00214937C1|nr:hypothetical protein [Pseudalkalibacillus decolorationis]
MLEAIFDLVFSNLFFVILILGGLFSFFKRQFEKYNDKQNPQNSRPKRTVQHEPATVSEPEETFDRNDPKMKMGREMQHVYEQTRSKLDPEKKREQNRKPVIKKAQKPRGRLVPSANHVAEGVVWSEILGPPRAKRPYAPKNRRGI